MTDNPLTCREARPTHGDLWVRKADFTMVGVLMVCGTHGEPMVSGPVYLEGDYSYAMPLDDFLDKHLLMGVDPDLIPPDPKAEALAEALREIIDVHHRTRNGSLLHAPDRQGVDECPTSTCRSARAALAEWEKKDG